MSSISGECGIGTKDPAPLPETISAQDRFISAYPHVPRGRASVEGNTSHIGTTSVVSLGSFGLIMTVGLRPDAVKPGIHCVRTIAVDPGFHGVRMVRCMRTMILMVPMCPESGFLGRATRLRPASKGGCGSWRRTTRLGRASRRSR